MNTYKIFTAEHDQVAPGSIYKDKVFGSSSQAKSVINKWLREFSCEEELHVSAPDTPKTFLVDASGSMRGQTIMTTVAALIKAGDALHAAGTSFEILAHTTTAWKGGKPRQEWMDQGNPPAPGRLNALLHIVLKDRGEAWPDARENVFGLLAEGVLKENIDGEAVAWAAERMRAHENPGQMIIFSDGTPMDDSTLAVNEITILDDHLVEVLGKELASGLDIRTLRICNGVGPERTIYPDAESVTMRDLSDRSINTAAMLQALQTLMDDKLLEKENAPALLEP